VEDKRAHGRVPLNIQMSCERAGGAAFQVLAKDISLGGMYLESDAAVSFGAELTFIGRLPGAKADSRLPAVVRWTKPGGFGVQFGLLGALETHIISQLLKPKA
jgi:hypothetical protein